MPVPQQVGIGQLAIVAAAGADHAFPGHQGGGVAAEDRGGQRQQPQTGLGRRLAQRDRRDLDGLAGDGRALVGAERAVAEHDGDLFEVQIEFLGDDLRQRRADAGAKIDMAVVADGAAVGTQQQHEFVAPAIGGGSQHDQRGAVRITHDAASTAAASRAAARISRWVPQRHR